MIANVNILLSIIGGGLAGATAGGLMTKLRDAEVKIFERSDLVREVGALIGVSVSGKRFQASLHAVAVTERWKTANHAF